MAVVSIRSARPVPLPKCLVPETRYGSPSMQAGRSGSGTAVALVLEMSPPLPGSEVTVAHWWPPAAESKAAWRCASQAGSDGSGVASQ